MNTDLLKGKSVLIMGLGLFGGGVDCAKFAAKSAKKVVITDTGNEKKLADPIRQLKTFDNIEFHLGGHTIEDFTTADVVIVNPAINESENEYLRAAKNAGAVITSQMEIFFQLCAAKIVAITGSNGKSTTTALTAHLLENAANSHLGKIFLSGNIGNRPLLESLGQITTDDIVVLELSSFQLEQLGRIKKSPNVSCVTNLAPNHLDRHKTMENYAAAKENILKFQTQNDTAILNAYDKQCLQWHKKYKNSVLFDRENLNNKLTEVFKLPGKANAENLAAAVEIAHQLGLKDEQLINAIESFKPLPHRLQLVSEIDGIRFYNDSISTTPESTIVAVEAFDEPKILIAGGYDKGLSFDKMAEIIADKLKALVLIGKTAAKIEKLVSKENKDLPIFKFDSLSAAVAKAKEVAINGDVILLSPACASYDMFTNFVDRGNQFTELVNRG